MARLPLARIAAVALLAGACSGKAEQPSATQSPAETVQRMRTQQSITKIRLVVNGERLTAELEDNAVAREFAALLPLELTLRDYNRTEKIADLPSRLSIAEAPEGIDPAAGDIAYYAPWGNLAIFYRDFGYSRGLIRLARIEGTIAGLAGTGPVVVRIELAH